MAIRSRNTTLEATVDRLVREATDGRGVPWDDAHYAAQATLRTLGTSWGPLTRFEVSRAESYFAAVLRRRAARRGADAAFSGRYLLAAVIDDLRSGGKSDHEILRELEEDWAPRVPRTVMDEYRHALTPPISA